MAKDIYHEIVKEALIKDGWTITDDPFKLEHLDKKMNVDLGAERLLAAQRGTEKIAVEIKSFLSRSRIYDFYGALGQYKTYMRILGKKDGTRIMFLAVPEDVYTDFFSKGFGQEAIFEEHLKIIVFDADTKEVIQWIK